MHPNVKTPVAIRAERRANNVNAMEQTLAMRQPIPAAIQPTTAPAPRTNTPRMIPISVSQIGHVIRRTMPMTIFLELL